MNASTVSERQNIKVLITGGSGFIGTNLVEYLMNKYIVLNIDKNSPRNKDHHKYWVNANILNLEKIKSIIEQFNPDYLIHLAARTDLQGKTVDDYSENVDGVRNIITSISESSNLKKIIFASSRLVCKIGYSPMKDDDYCPTTAYGESKVLGEKIVRENMPANFDWVIVRPTSIWGPWFDIPYKTFFQTISNGRYFHPAGCKIMKSFGFVGNTTFELEKIVTSNEKSITGKTIYLADYPPIEVSSMAECIQKNLNSAKIKSINVNTLKFAASAGDLLNKLGWKNPPLTTFRLNNLLQPMIHDLSPLENLVGPLPYTMEQGVQETCKWLLSENANK